MCGSLISFHKITQSLYVNSVKRTDSVHSVLVRKPCPSARRGAWGDTPSTKRRIRFVARDSVTLSVFLYNVK